jgi:hypothetical protein
MARNGARLDFMFMGTVLVLMVGGLALHLTGIAPRVGLWIAIGAFGLAWVPAILAIIFITIPNRRRR